MTCESTQQCKSGRIRSRSRPRFTAAHPESRITLTQAHVHVTFSPIDLLQLVRKEGAIHFRRVTPESIRDMFIEEIRAFNTQIPDNWKELAAAGLYEWRALMETSAGPGGASPDDYCGPSSGGAY